jgi:hypothetical protein
LAWQAIETKHIDSDSTRFAQRIKGIRFVALSLLIAAVIDIPLIMNARRETPTRPAISAEIFSSDLAFKEVRSVTNGTHPIAELDESMLQRVDAMQVHFNSTSIRTLIDGKFVSNPLQSTPGALAFGVGFIGLFVAGRRTWGWAAIAAGATGLTLGPFLNISGALLLDAMSTRWPLPYYWAYEFVPFFAKAYRPYRICVISTMCLATIGAIGASAWIRSSQRPKLNAPLVLFGLFAFSQPLWSGEKPAFRPLADTEIDDAFHQMAGLESGGVIHLPLHYQPVSTANARTQYQQTAHEHPILNSNQLIRWPDLLRFKSHVNANQALSTFVNLSRKEPPHTIDSESILALQQQGYRWIVAQKSVHADNIELAGEMVSADLLPPSAWDLLFDLFQEPIIETSAIVVWDLHQHVPIETETSENDFSFTPVSMIFDPIKTGFPLVLAPGQTFPLYQGPAHQFHAWILAVSPAASLHLRIEGDGIVQEKTIPVETSQWNYTRLDIDANGEVELSLVGRGDHASKVHITHAGVVP